MRQFSEKDLLKCEESINLNDTMEKLFGDFVDYDSAHASELNRACICNRFEIPEFLLTGGAKKYGYMFAKKYLGYLFELDTPMLRAQFKCKRDYYEKFLLDMGGVKYFSLWKYCTQVFNSENAERAMRLVFFDRDANIFDISPINSILEAYTYGDYSYLLKMVHADDYEAVTEKGLRKHEEAPQVQESYPSFSVLESQSKEVKEEVKKPAKTQEVKVQEPVEDDCKLHFVGANRRPRRNIMAKTIVPNRVVVEPRTQARYESKNNGTFSVGYRGALPATSYKVKGVITQKTEYAKSRDILPKHTKFSSGDKVQSGYVYRDMLYSNLFELCSYLEVPVGYVSSRSYLWKKFMGAYDVTSIVDSYLRRNSRISVNGTIVRSDYELNGLADNFYESDDYSRLMRDGVARVMTY